MEDKISRFTLRRWESLCAQWHGNALSWSDTGIQALQREAQSGARLASGVVTSPTPDELGVETAPVLCQYLWKPVYSTNEDEDLGKGTVVRVKKKDVEVKGNRRKEGREEKASGKVPRGG